MKIWRRLPLGAQAAAMIVGAVLICYAVAAAASQGHGAADPQINPISPDWLFRYAILSVVGMFWRLMKVREDAIRKGHAEQARAIADLYDKYNRLHEGTTKVATQHNMAFATSRCPALQFMAAQEGVPQEGLANIRETG